MVQAHMIQVNDHLAINVLHIQSINFDEGKIFTTLGKEYTLKPNEVETFANAYNEYEEYQRKLLISNVKANFELIIDRKYIVSNIKELRKLFTDEKDPRFQAETWWNEISDGMLFKEMNLELLLENWNKLRQKIFEAMPI